MSASGRGHANDASIASINAATSVSCAAAASNNYVFHTSLGDIEVTLRPDVAPATVANFLSYVNAGSYTDSLIHRSVPGFVIQGGAYVDMTGQVDAIATNGSIASEASLPNVRGTIAMALSTGPNTATSQWFFNLADNSAALDGTGDGGPFTVFGSVATSQGFAVMDAIAALQVVDASGSLGQAFSALPVINYNSGSVTAQNLVLVNTIAVASTTPDFSVSASPETLTLVSGQSGMTTVTVTSENGYSGTVTFSCSDLPANASCSFSPASVTVAASGAAQTTTLTIETTKSPTASLGNGGRGRSAPIGLAGLLAAATVLGAMFFSGGAARVRTSSKALACVVALGAFASCGGSSSGSGLTTPAGTYSIPITIGDGSTSHPLGLTVIVH